ncbi:hypothetical protein KAREA_49670 (plasmid) [Prescottella equi]|uniref:Uncharacterized protein n=1 Tax=Rhodococcus hoagii TaxID=43767 RepID=Q9EU28_RHOHA|nr:unknown [Prescottella equi]ADI50247.1 hypothetical protein pVAPA_0580 [Prescottella equi]CAQ30405.1 hypothetical protein pVAPA_0580 [Prescottella equi]BAB16620.1 hypothetical protein [Prescottella equi]BDC75052.1 hypothetical protein KAREA_49670 [Prescottella equi]
MSGPPCRLIRSTVEAVGAPYVDVLGRSLSMPPVTDLMHGNARLMHRRRELEDVVSCGGSFEHGRHGVFISSMPLWWMTIVVTTSKVLSRLTIESGALLDSSGKVTGPLSTHTHPRRCPSS